MKANILVNGTACIKTIVKQLSQISDLSDIKVNNNSVVSFIYHSEEAALRVFEELGSGDQLRKSPLRF